MKIFLGHLYKLNIWRCGYNAVTNQMIAHDIIGSFGILSLLNYDRIFVKNLEHNTYGVK